MNERRRLLQVELEGPRAWVRGFWFWSVMMMSAIGGIGYLLPAHRLANEDWHSNYADGGVLPLISFGVVLLVAALLRKKKLGAGMLTGVIATAGAVVAVIPVILVHLFSHVETGLGEGLFGAGVFALAFGGAIMLIAEPLLYWTQRRSLERRDPPQVILPMARVIA